MRRAALAFAIAVAACGSGREAPAPDADAPAATAAPDTPVRADEPDAVADSAPAAPASADWTAGIVDLPGAAAGAPVLRAVRAARHDGFDRVVWEFDGGRPGVHVEYVDAPVRECGSGRPVALPGDGWLEVRLEPAAAHAEGGSTIESRRFAPDLPVVLEAALTCDFEAVVAWVLAASSPEPYRVRALEDPARIVVDVRHRSP